MTSARWQPSDGRDCGNAVSLLMHTWDHDEQFLRSKFLQPDCIRANKCTCLREGMPRPVHCTCPKAATTPERLTIRTPASSTLRCQCQCTWTLRMCMPQSSTGDCALVACTLLCRVTLSRSMKMKKKISGSTITGKTPRLAPCILNLHRMTLRAPNHGPCRQTPCACLPGRPPSRPGTSVPKFLFLPHHTLPA